MIAVARHPDPADSISPVYGSEGPRWVYLVVVAHNQGATIQTHVKDPGQLALCVGWTPFKRWSDALRAARTFPGVVYFDETTKGREGSVR